MSTLTATTISLPVANPPQQNPFPDFSPVAHTIHFCKEDFPGEEIYPLYGFVDNNLPYPQQDKYERTLAQRDVPAIVLENETLRAVFLPEYGCRLWSLYHKKAQRELLYKNPVLRFGNLAIRNAWFAGGVEWNLGWMGHTPFTCDTLFCERVTDTETGTPILRFYEFERKREIHYVVEAYLPDDSECLFVRVRIENPTDHTVPVYWWSNMAAPETEHTRVVTDADTAFHNHPVTQKFMMADILHYDGTQDVTYPHQMKKSVDFFFRVPRENRKFIAALDKTGAGLVQTSTDALRGRKLFLWGSHKGGKRWQKFLSNGDNSYLEIQAGLAHTQMESVPLEAGKKFEWLEAYGLMDADPTRIHGDWEQAKAEAATRLDVLISRAALDHEMARIATSIPNQPGTRLMTGSGWGALEQLYRRTAGQQAVSFPSFDPESLTEAQRPWAELLQHGTFMPPDKAEAMSCYCMSEPKWISLLLRAAEAGDNWFLQYHLGVLYHANGKAEDALQAFTRSLKLKDTVWARHALLMLGKQQPAADEIGTLTRESVNYWTARDTMTLYLHSESFDAACAFYTSLPAELRENGRMRLLYALALIGTGNADACGEILSAPFEIADLREGELSLQSLWVAYQNCLRQKQGKPALPKEELLQKQPVPDWMDFLMNENSTISN